MLFVSLFVSVHLTKTSFAILSSLKNFILTKTFHLLIVSGAFANTGLVFRLDTAREEGRSNVRVPLVRKLRGVKTRLLRDRTQSREHSPVHLLGISATTNTTKIASNRATS